MEYLIYILFLAIPLAAIVFFVVSLCRFIAVRRKSKLLPYSVDSQVVKSGKTMLIISSAIVGVLVAVVVGFIILFALSIKNM